MKRIPFMQRFVSRNLYAGRSVRAFSVVLRRRSTIRLFFFCAFCISQAAFSQVQLCPGTCSDFINNYFPNATSFQWTFAGANPSTSTDENPTNICYNTPGSYNVTLIATDSAGSDTLVLNNFVTVYPYPPPQGILESGDTLIANTGAVAYQWYLNGSPIPGATDYFYVTQPPIPPGDLYCVVAIDANGCEVEGCDQGSIGSSGNDLEIFVTVFPNPASSWLSVSTSALLSPSQWKIFNLHGEVVMAVQPFATANPSFGGQTTNHIPIAIGTETSVDVSALPKGMYWLEINSIAKVYRSKFIKQ